MAQITCPSCGTKINLDETEYNNILNEVKTQAFDAEVNRRMAELEEQMKTQQELANQTTENKHQQALNAKDKTISDKEAEINLLKEQIKNAKLEERNALQEDLKKKELDIANLESKINLAAKEAALNEKSIKEQYETKISEQKESFKKELELKEEQVQQLKDFKSKLGTKLLGEDLEQHCLISYDQYVRPFLTNATFGKDNDTTEGTKGDFIFRETVNGVESVSIMFEMKNESEESTTHQKNAGFFKKLDEDRKKKNCEYAVLVTMLEKDNEFYNNGIVSATGYEKMYVIRPQFFLPLLSILRQSGQNTMECKQQLEAARRQTVDVTNFEQRMGEFARVFGKHCKNALNQRQEAIKQLDNIITACQKAKEALRLEGGHYDDAEKNLQEKFTVRALTAGNLTMAAKFDEAQKANANNLPNPTME